MMNSKRPSRVQAEKFAYGQLDREEPFFFSFVQSEAGSDKWVRW